MRNVMYLLVVVSTVVAGCSKTTRSSRADDSVLRERVLAEHREYLSQTAAGGVIEVTRDVSDVESRLSPERLDELNEMSGSAAYEGVVVEPGKDLLGQTTVQAVKLALSDAVDRAVAGNLDLAVARLSPSIAEQQLLQAESAFDSVFFAETNWQKLDTPQPAGVVPGLAGDTQSEQFILNTGIRKQINQTGGTVQVETSLTRDERVPSVFGTSSYYDADVLVSLSQPLLRNFGTDDTRAQIELARNADGAARADLRQAINELLRQVEEAYWNLDFTWSQMLIQQRLLDRTIAERDRLEQRKEFDVSPVRLTEANSFVELRRSDVIRARAAVRTASDRLKRLMNHEGLPLAQEALIRPTTKPTDDPITFSLLDSVTTAMRERPELEASLLAVSDAGVRQRLADDGTLPLLDLTASVGANGIDNDEWNESYSELAELNYIDYILGLRFEQPLGNRGAEALQRQRQFERDQAVTDYRREAQDVVLDVKNALRDVLTNYELVGSTRSARRAAANSLRAINVQEEVGQALTDEFILDLKLTTQERLANTEVQEAQALAAYMTAIAELHRSTGTLLNQYGVEVEPASE